MSYEARIEKDSITQYGERLTTFVVTFPRIVLAEFNTHRMFSRSSASSRAIPVKTQVERLYKDQFLPVHWGKNQKGMQADEELQKEQIVKAMEIWTEAMYAAIKGAEMMMDVGVHKQITNRLLEPFMWHTVIVSATEWANFFHLRDSKMAQPEIQKAAGMMSELYRASRPQLLDSKEWHLPFDQGEDQAYSAGEKIRISVGRSARVSYLNHEGQRDPADDIRLANSLLHNGHMAPWEHVARPMTPEERSLFGNYRRFTEPSKGSLGEASWITGERQYFLGNFNGWVQARKLIYGEQDILAFDP